MDSVSNFINKLKIASKGKKPSFQFPASRYITAIAEALAGKGFLAGVAKKGKRKETLEMKLVYTGTVPKVHMVKRVSLPSKRIYRQARELRPVRQGSGIAVLSTPKGILADSDARQQNAGGEVLFEIW